MNEYTVTFEGDRTSCIVEADNFHHNIIANTIIFVDKEKKAVALFDKIQVQHIIRKRTKKEEQDVADKIEMFDKTF